MSNPVVIGPIVVRKNVLALGQIIDGHTHNFDHVSYVPFGGLRFELLDADNNVVRTIEKWARDGDTPVLIKAERRHRIVSLQEGSVLHCIYPHINPETNEIVAEYNGWGEAYV